MIGQYRFLRTRGGITSFASVTVVSSPDTTLRISWDPSLSDLHIYGSSVEAGVEAAFREHQMRGGEPQAVHVSALVETTVDTKPDAVKCHAAIAAWKAWGNPESDATIANDEGEWRVGFRIASQKSTGTDADPRHIV